MARNLTLTIDEDLLPAARKVALDWNVSVNAMVRDHLAEVTAQVHQRSEACATLEKLFEARPGPVGPVSWRRDELCDRKA